VSLKEIHSVDIQILLSFVERSLSRDSTLNSAFLLFNVVAEPVRKDFTPGNQFWGWHQRGILVFVGKMLGIALGISGARKLLLCVGQVTPIMNVS